MEHKHNNSTYTLYGMQEEEREDGNLKTVIVTNSVVGPNTWNLDPDPGFWPNLDTGTVRIRIQIQIQGYTINFERKNSK